MVEHVREYVRRMPKVSLVGLLAGLLSMVAILLIVTRLSATQDTATQAGVSAATVKALGLRNCGQIENVKAEIRAVVAQQLSTLGRPGTAGFSYYSTHPAELQQAIMQLHGELFTFRSLPCK